MACEKLYHGKYEEGEKAGGRCIRYEVLRSVCVAVDFNEEEPAGVTYSEGCYQGEIY